MGRVTDLAALDALAVGTAVRSGAASAVEVVETVLSRAERLDPSLGVFVTRTPDLALRQARSIDALLRSTDDVPPSPLLGVPCPVKDLNPVAGVRYTLGSAAFDDQVADVDDGIVTLLRRAGTLLTGKTNTPEIGLPCYTEPDVAPAARTPWDPARSAGGSSGGAAVAVAAGLAPIAHGSDGGGSIRIPASACGVVGLKPTRGRVSPGPYGVDVAGLAVTGPLARTVADAAALLDVMAQPWPGDVTLLPSPASSFLDSTQRTPPRLRVGVLTTPVIAADAVVHPACMVAAERTGTLLAELGHHVEVADVPFAAERWDAFAAVWACLAASFPVPAEREHLLRPLTRWLRDQGRDVAGVDYVAAIAGTQALAREVAERWSQFDLVVSPTLADLPAPLGTLRDDADPAADFAAQTRFTPWTSVWNLIGRPALSLPLEWHEHADRVVPVGVMLGAGFAREELLLSVAAELERARPWQHRYTALWAGL
jgi:amidase